jgi:DNA invertase Pin-like site-specific DNA recombinase
MEQANFATPQDLLEIIKAGLPTDKQDIDTSTINYALYARKSTQGDEKQERSIDDQISDCIDRVMQPLDITPKKVIKEKFSAKEPDTRVKFRELIEDIKAGRINGIIAWHPDRLARNMKEAGEIIDLLDKGTLRDLKFATFTFENTPEGIMTLGIIFVMAKQYTDHLSKNVLRGNKRYTEDAAEYLGKFKHGYYIDGSRHLIPDSTFTYIRHMIDMRLEGHTQKQIAEWINQQGYKVRRRGQDPRPFNWDKDDVSKFLRDPLNAGVLLYGNGVVNLIEKYGFVPLMTVDEFMKINKVSIDDTIRAAAKARTGIRANLLRGLVYCGACNKSLTSMIIDKKARGRLIESRYYYKCETLGCEVSGKSARAGLVVNAAKEFFATYLFTTNDNYTCYVENAKKALKHNTVELESNIGRAKQAVGDKKKKYKDATEFILNHKELAEHYNLDSMSKDVSEAEKQLADLISQRGNVKNSIATYEQYLKILESAPVILDKIHDMDVMDNLLRIFFSKFVINPNSGKFNKGSKAIYKLNEPWAGFILDKKFVIGAGEETLTLDLFLGKEAL